MFSWISAVEYVLLLISIMLTSLGAHTLFTTPNTKTGIQRIISRATLIILVLFEILTLMVLMGRTAFSSPPEWMQRGRVVVVMTVIAVVIGVVFVLDRIASKYIGLVISDSHNARLIQSTLGIITNTVSIFTIACCVLFIKRFAVHLHVSFMDLLIEIMKKYKGYRFIGIAILRCIVIGLGIYNMLYYEDQPARDMYFCWLPMILAFEFYTYVELSFKTIRRVFEDHALNTHEDYEGTNKIRPVEVLRARAPHQYTNPQVVMAAGYTPSTLKSLDVQLYPTQSEAVSAQHDDTSPAYQIHVHDQAYSSDKNVSHVQIPVQNDHGSENTLNSRYSSQHFSLQQVVHDLQQPTNAATQQTHPTNVSQNLDQSFGVDESTEQYYQNEPVDPNLHQGNVASATHETTSSQEQSQSEVHQDQQHQAPLDESPADVANQAEQQKSTEATQSIDNLDVDQTASTTEPTSTSTARQNRFTLNAQQEHEDYVRSLLNYQFQPHSEFMETFTTNERDSLQLRLQLIPEDTDQPESERSHNV